MQVSKNAAKLTDKISQRGFFWTQNSWLGLSWRQFSLFTRQEDDIDEKTYPRHWRAGATLDEYTGDCLPLSSKRVL